jgi:hypothetical protein
MKNILLAATFVITIISLCSYSNGSFTSDYMGFGLGSSCAQIGCHVGIGTSGAQYPIAKIVGSNGVDLATTGNSWVMGETYDVEITAPASSSRVGFQALFTTFMTDSGVGNIANTVMPANIQIWASGVKNRNYISHTTTGMTAAVSAGIASFKFKWTAPSTNVGALKFAVTLNKSNANGNANGDSILQGNYVMQAPTTSVGISHHAAVKSLEIYPNPATDFILLNAEVNEYAIYNLSGVLVKAGKLHNSEKRIAIATLASGSYYLLAKDQKGQLSRAQFSK